MMCCFQLCSKSSREQNRKVIQDERDIHAARAAAARNYLANQNNTQNNLASHDTPYNNTATMSYAPTSVGKRGAGVSDFDDEFLSAENGGGGFALASAGGFGGVSYAGGDSGFSGGGGMSSSGGDGGMSSAGGGGTSSGC